MCRQIYSNLQLDFSVGFHSVPCYVLTDPLLGRGVESGLVVATLLVMVLSRGSFAPHRALGTSGDILVLVFICLAALAASHGVFFVEHRL